MFEIDCGTVTPSAKRPGALCLKIGKGGNIRLRMADLHGELAANVPSVFHDLIEIATYVYVADQAIPRADGGSLDPTAAKSEIGLGWRRSLSFRIPVRNPDFWNSIPVRDVLGQTLEFLSDDVYRFRFRPQKKPVLIQRQIEFGQTPFHGEIDDVMLFSGGLDSLAGAVHESLVNHRRMLLVNHQSHSKFSKLHETLQGELANRTQVNPHCFLSVRINKSKALGLEFTQRSRSFLFASLAASIAAMVGRDRILFYENGVISLNLPISSQLVGARATRTTHPRVLDGFAQLFSLVAGKSFAVENPFQWKTKTEVVKVLADAGVPELIRFSRSCAETRAMRKAHPHCGICSQCVDRRFAVLAAGQSAHDSERGYAHDLMRGVSPNELTRTLVASYCESANQIRTLTLDTFFARYGETVHILPYCGDTIDASARKIFDLHQRHAISVTTVMEQAIVSAVSIVRERSLPRGSLLWMICHLDENGSEKPLGQNDMSPPNFFRQCGQAWEVRFDGRQRFILLLQKGATYLHQLLGKPFHTFSVQNLIELHARRPIKLSGTSDRIFDFDAWESIHQQCEELKQDREQAIHDHDYAEQSRIDHELELLQAEIKKATSKGGEIRRMQEEREQVRKAIGNAIRRTLKEIAKYDSALLGHLKSPQLILGRELRYCPNPPIEWSTEKEMVPLLAM